jgi:hypothetical protein
MSAVAKRKKCRVKGCNRKAFARGVCHACYELMRQSVNSGETSWSDLESTGVILRDRRFGERSPVHSVIDRAKKKRERAS